MYARPSNKSIRDLLREVERSGWSIIGGGQRHYQMRCPNECKCHLTLSASPSNKNESKLTRRRLANHTCWEPKNDHPAHSSRQQRPRPIPAD